MGLIFLIFTVMVDGYPFVAETIGNKTPSLTVTNSEEWNGNHGREFQYLLQAVRYTDIAFCSPFEPS